MWNYTLKIHIDEYDKIISVNNPIVKPYNLHSDVNLLLIQLTIQSQGDIL